MGNHPVPHPNWRHGVAETDLHRLQPMLQAIRGLLQRGLMDVEILWTFFSRGAQPLRRREVNTRMHLGPSCPDCPFSTDLGNTGINTRIRGVLASGVDSLWMSPRI
jgi:hypothetical protein